jgi:argininosuccinate synthase
VVLAYSGGLDTSVIIRWLIESYGCEVIAFAADIGQGTEVKTLRSRALASGATKVFIKDLKQEFVRDFVFPILRAGAVYEGQYLLGTSIARPLIELTYYSIDPHIKVIAPWREWKMKGRRDLVRYAKTRGIQVPVTRKKPYSTDRNLFHISFEGGPLEDTWRPPPEDMFVMSVSPEKAPSRPTHVEIGFKGGDPVTINGKRMSPALLLERLNRLGGRNGIGRVDCVESRFVGMKSRGVYETPGGTILHEARRAVESITMDREVMHLRDSLAGRYSELVYNGYWFSPEREAMQKLVDEAVKGVTGTARLKLYKGNAAVVGRKAPVSLYHPDFATFEEDTVYDQKDAEGFIKINALRLKLKAMI